MRLKKVREWIFKKSSHYFSQKDSRVLLLLASKWYTADKYEFGSTQWNSFEQLFATLVNLLVSVKNEKGQWVWTYSRDYFGRARLNHLITRRPTMWITKWSDDEGKFANEKEPLTKKPDAIKLLTAMHPEDDSIAIKAFVQLTQYDTTSVR